MDQKDMAAGRPPQDPAYVNASRVNYVYAVYFTLWGVMVVVVLLRLYVRTWLLKRWGPDDFLMVAALVGSTCPVNK